MTTNDRLHRSSSEKMLAGVSGGLAEYFDVDVTLVRVGWVVLCFLTAGFALVGYLLLAIIMPRGDVGLSDMPRAARDDEAEAFGEDASRRTRRRDVFALALIAIGCVMLLSNFGVFWWLSWSVLWPLVLIGIGGVILAKRTQRG